MKTKMLLGIAALGLIGGAVSANAAELKTDKQKFSYSAGYQFGQNLKHQDMDLDQEAFLQAIRDAMAGNKPQLTEAEMQKTFEDFQKAQQQAQQAIADKNLQAGKAFREENKKKEGVKTLPSGLQYKIIKAGTGKKPTDKDTVSVNYRGTLLNGKEFDSSYSRGQPAEFPVHGIIKGWQEALLLMPVGSKWQLVIPAELAYGSHGAGRDIGPNETLVFEVELLEIKAAQGGKP